jgi:beta-N-acetylhexosaminidase
VVVSLHSPSELAPSAVQLVQDLAQRTQVTLVFLASPYHLSRLGQVDRFRAVLLAYEDTPQAQDLAAQAVFGGVAAPGTLPVAVPPFYGLEAGQPLASQRGGPGFRFKYTVPEELGLDRAILQKADSLTDLCVRERAAPGGVVLAAKDGKVFYFKAFGKHTYEGSTAVQPDDLYDLASVTKISTSVAAAMKLTDLGKFNVRSPWASVDKRTRRSNKANLTLADLLTHQSGLKAWIPFWKTRTDAQGRLLASWFSADSSRTYPHQVADRLYIHRRYAEDSLINEILQSPLSGKKDYVYSDLSYYLYPGMVKRQTGERFEDFLDEQFYQPLGAATLTFNPLRKFPRGRIVPTEYDSLFRRQLLVGTVHDEGAALFGGVSGHAGLFGNANDLAKLMQMYLNQGSYGGRQYLKASTVAEFARCQFCDPADPKKGNQRGLGFDRQRGANAAPSASAQGFGHSGFTGTFAWADPANGLLYIFLSNRVYPTRNNSRLSDLNIRTGIQEVFYEAIGR